MKQLLILSALIIGFNSYSQDNFFDTTCNCINQITEQSNQSLIAEQIQNCFQKSFQNHNSEIDFIVKNYHKENSNRDMKYAEQNLSKILTEKLAEKCPKFQEIDQKLASQQQTSENILEKVADEVCAELNKLPNLSDKTVDPILIEKTQKNQVSVYGQYNLSDRVEMKKYSYELNAELMNNCEVYKKFVIEKNSGK